MTQLSLLTPVGELTLSAADGAIVALDWGRGRDQAPDDLLRAATAQLNDYFDGARRGFDLPLDPAGTDYERAIWRAMCAIPYGETRTYGDLAAAIGGNPRLVGAACGSNPIPIIIPCHRVVGAGGRMVGYSGGEGVETKQALLRLEGALLI